MRIILPLLALLTVAQPATTSRLLADADIRRIITDRIDAQHQSIGIVVGVIDANGRRVIAHGRFDASPASVAL